MDSVKFEYFHVIVFVILFVRNVTHKFCIWASMWSTCQKHMKSFPFERSIINSRYTYHKGFCLPCKKRGIFTYSFGWVGFSLGIVPLSKDKRKTWLIHLGHHLSIQKQLFHVMVFKDVISISILKNVCNSTTKGFCNNIAKKKAIPMSKKKATAFLEARRHT